MSLTWFLGWCFAFPLLKVLTGVEIQGRVPRKGAYIIASNHTSFLDPPLIGITAGREVFFLAKIGLFTISKFFTWLIRSYNAIPISGTRGIRTALRLLKNKEVVVIFPEGTRSKKGYMLPFNPGFAYLAINFKVPVIPVYITNSNKRFLSLILRWHRLKIHYGKPISPIGYEANKSGYEQFAAHIRQEVLNLK